MAAKKRLTPMPKLVSSLATLPKRPAPVRRKNAPDWEAIERDYSANVLTGEQLAMKHGISRVSILNKARKNDWQRDLAVAIKRSVARKLISQTTYSDVGKPDQLVTLDTVKGDIQQVEAMANVTVGVILRHRSGIRDLQDIANGQLLELRSVTQGQDAMNLVLTAAAEGGVIDQESLKLAFKEVQALCRLPSRMGALAQLSAIYERLQSMERAAFAIKNDDNPTDDEDELKGILVGFVDAPYREVE